MTTKKYIRDADGSLIDVSGFELPWYIVGAQMTVLCPVVILFLIGTGFEKAGQGIQWCVQGRSFPLFLGRISTSIEIAWYQRQVRKSHGYGQLGK